MKFDKTDALAVSAIRALLIDEINKANSGHPGMALDIAPAMYVLYKNHLVADPKNPEWINRDRFVLSSGHNSALLYAMLHVAGYEVSMDDIKSFRQMHSKTPGHPEFGWTKGVDATGGPLGQGVAQAVGMAMAEAHIAASYQEGEKIMNHYTYCLCGDGCLEEGISQEAISLAGKQKLNKLILIYDKNQSTLDGPTTNSMTEDEMLRFQASEWNTIEVKDGNDLEEIDAAIEAAKKSDKPTMIQLNTIIGYGTPKVGSHTTHGSPLGAELGAQTKANLGWNEPEFTVPASTYEVLAESFGKRGAEAYKAYQAAYAEYKATHPEDAKVFEAAFARDVTPFAIAEPAVGEKPDATRNSSGKMLVEIAKAVPFTFGGSADVASSVKTAIPGDAGFDAEHRAAKNINFGIREFVMAAAQNGMLLHGGVISYVGAFLVFSDYMKNAIRMSAIQHLPAIYLFSHDSIAVGEDGPTHEPIEQLVALRSIPGVEVIRPADTRECIAAWKLAIATKDHPVCLILSRQNLQNIEGSCLEAVAKGAYVTVKEEAADLELIATGSEVGLAVNAAKLLKEKSIKCSVISMPSVERFEALSKEEKDAIITLPKAKRVAIEMLSGLSWYKYADNVISQDEFGYSGPADLVMAECGFTAEKVAEKIAALLA
ncbi:MAG: transketolase [Bacilli bacterium]|nr:transketolase [Bacilli bacterium]